jgi:hypothetical protein
VAMSEEHYFYSVDGIEVKGPADPGTIRQLIQEGTLGAGHHLCREGTTDWQPINPALFLGSAVIPLIADSVAPAGASTPASKPEAASLWANVLLIAAAVVFLGAGFWWLWNALSVGSAERGDPLLTSMYDEEAWGRAKVLLREQEREIFDTNGSAGKADRISLQKVEELVDKISELGRKEGRCGVLVQSMRKADLDAQLSDLREIQMMEVNLVPYLGEFDLSLRGELNRQQVPANEHQAAITTSTRVLRLYLVQAYEGTNLNFCNAAIARLDFLRSHWGQWEIKGGQVVFADEGLSQQHAELLEGMLHKAKAMAAISKNLIDPDGYKKLGVPVSVPGQ